MTITTDKWSDQIENPTTDRKKNYIFAKYKNRFSYMSQLNAKSILMSHKVNE